MRIISKFMFLFGLAVVMLCSASAIFAFVAVVTSGPVGEIRWDDWAWAVTISFFGVVCGGLSMLIGSALWGITEMLRGEPTLAEGWAMPKVPNAIPRGMFYFGFFMMLVMPVVFVVSLLQIMNYSPTPQYYASQEIWTAIMVTSFAGFVAGGFAILVGGTLCSTLALTESLDRLKWERRTEG